MKNLESLLQQLKQKNVKLQVKDNKLNFQDPEKYVKGKVLDTIKKYKPEILSLISENSKKKSICGNFVEEANIPVSKIQIPLLFAEYLTEIDSRHNLSLSYKYNKTISVEKLLASLKVIVEKNASLRLGYLLENGKWKAKLNDVKDFLIDYVNIDEIDINEQYGGINEYSYSYTSKKFEFNGTPLTRVQVCELDNQGILLNFSIHHAICDGFSLANISQMIDFLLFEPEKGDELFSNDASYLDYLFWQEKNIHSEGLAYWRKKLEGAPSNINLPCDFSRPQSVVFKASTVQQNLDSSIVKKLNLLSEKQKVSQFNILLTAFCCLLSRYSSQDDIVIGVPFLNREQPEILNTVGLFINTLPIRIKLSKDMNFEGLLEQVFATVREASSHQQTPLIDIVETVNPSRSASFSPLFQVLANYLDIQGAAVDSSSSIKSEVLFDNKKDLETNYDLTLNIRNTEDGLTLSFEYSNALFKDETIQRMKFHYVKLLNAFLDNPKKNLISHNILSEDEISFIRSVNLNGKALRKFKNPFEYIKENANKFPDKKAIIFQNKDLTFSKLSSKIETVANLLIRTGVKKGDRVGLYFTRSPEMVCAIYACFKIGAIYVPLDPAYPSNRIKYIISETALTCILSISILNSFISKLALNTETIFVDKNYQCEVTDLPATKLMEDDSAYVIHTSGTTGNPKGVNVSHGNLHNLLSSLDETFDDSTVQVWLAQTSISFDISIVELIWTLTRGHTIVLQQSRNVDLVDFDTKNTSKPLNFSIMFFSEDSEDEDKYDLMLRSSSFADQNGFQSVWLPERHFGEFGGAFANPSITCAALSTITKNINLRAGSVVLPLHDPVRVAEEWSMIDNLSNGRVGLAFASGWHPNDFVFEGASFTDRREQLKDKLSQLKNLWEGKAISRINGLGITQEVTIRPVPKQRKLPTWITAAGNPETFHYAGTIGANILTHMLGQSLEGLESNIAIYHQALLENGFSIEHREITLMLHTYLDKSDDIALSTSEVPFKKYINSSLNLISPIAEEMGIDLDENREQVIDVAFNRLSKNSALFGSAESCQKLLNTIHNIGVTEIASLIDFGVETSDALNSLQVVAEAKDIYRAEWSLAKHLSQVEYQSELELIHEHGVNHVQMTPSQLKILIKQYEINPLEINVSRWLVGGENLTQNLVDQLKKTGSGRCYNMYGPTETTVWSAWQDVTETSVCIGKPCLNTDFYLLDKAQQLVPRGIVGELYIGGKGVTKGYWNQNELTSNSFKNIEIEGFGGEKLYKTGDMMKMMNNGMLQYVGRIDDQIKINGYRIEPNEIEYNLLSLVGIKDCRVIVKTNSEGEAILAAYLVKSDIVSGEWTKLPADKETKTFTFADGSLVYHKHESDQQLRLLYREIFEDNIYFRHGVELAPNDLIFDVGANIGAFSMYVQKCQPSVNVVAFEPIPEIFSSLKKNFEHRNINGFIHNSGMSDKNETATFTYNKKNPELSGGFEETKRAKLAAKAWISDEKSLRPNQHKEDIDSYSHDIDEPQEVECRLDTISNIIKHHEFQRIDLLKVNVEKSECLTLKGIGDKDWKKIKQIVIKVGGNENLKFVKELLFKRGFTIKVVEYTTVESNVEKQLNAYMLYAKNTKFSPTSVNQISKFYTPSSADIRSRLLEYLPDFMIPAEIHTIDEIPLLGNGKIDYSKLKSLESNRIEKQARNYATNSNEIRLSNIWNKILGREACPIEVSFFELGGTSLSIVSLHAQIQSEFKVDIKIVDLFRYKTIKEQSNFIKLILKSNIHSQNEKTKTTRERIVIPKRRKKSDSSNKIHRREE
jgi:natural product biosynthesis luciferase-like monooxygenase protein/FkbM family methyltransferase